MKYISEKILKGGTREIFDKINEISSNRNFVIIICLILAAYSARVSQGYTLPSTLYSLFDNLFAKILTFIIIIIISQFNKSIGIMLILSYVLLMIAYYKQNGIEGFENMIYGIRMNQSIEGFSNPSDENKEEEQQGEEKEKFVNHQEEEKHSEEKEKFVDHQEEESGDDSENKK